jgi:hypothetical protein
MDMPVGGLTTGSTPGTACWIGIQHPLILAAGVIIAKTGPFTLVLVLL